MTPIKRSSEVNGSRFGSLSTAGKVRFVAFTFVALALLALNVVWTPPPVLLAAFDGWFGEFGVHQVHDMTTSAFIWLAIVVPIGLLLYHPAGRINTVLAPVVLLVPMAALAFVSNSFLFGPFTIMGALALLALALHPAGRAVVRFHRVESLDRRLAGLFAVGAIPLLGYAGLEIGKQVGPVDDHAAFVHYGGMAVAAFLVVVMGALAVSRRRDWRFAAWTAGLMAAFVGLVSVAYPTVESSLGTIAGVLLLLWAVLFVAGVEFVRRSDAEAITSRAETEAEPA